MRIANIADIKEEKSGSPSGKFCTIDRPLNEAIGGDSRSTDLNKRWPFDVELTRIPAGATNYPFHSHANLYEFYLIVSGRPTVRHKDGTTEAKPGDFFMCEPGEPHHMINNTSEDVLYYCIADNPTNDHVYYNDSDKWLVRIPQKRMLIRGKQVEDYYDGEAGA
jgi:uncharacterized cupin superfamily protein